MWWSVTSGAIAGVVSTTVTNPLDVVRARLQASRVATRGVGGKDFRATLRTMHYSCGYFCGLGPNLVASVPANAVYLTTYTRLRASLATLRVIPDPLLPPVAALGATGCTGLLLNPLFIVRLRAQLMPGCSTREVIQGLWAEGCRGFYRGLGAGILGRSCESAVYWTLYEYLKRSGPRTAVLAPCGGGVSTPEWAAAVMSWSSVAKVTAAVLTYPYNVVRTHLWEVDPITLVAQHHTVIKAARYIFRHEGVRGFYAGLTPHILRTIPSTAVTFAVFEVLTARRPPASPLPLLRRTFVPHCL